MLQITADTAEDFPKWIPRPFRVWGLWWGHLRASAGPAYGGKAAKLRGRRNSVTRDLRKRDQAEAEGGLIARNDESNGIVANLLRNDSAGSAGSASAAVGSTSGTGQAIGERREPSGTRKISGESQIEGIMIDCQGRTGTGGVLSEESTCLGSCRTTCSSCLAE